MPVNYPQISFAEATLEVAFCDPVRRETTVPISIIVDLDLSGKIIGIEIINLFLQIGHSCLDEIARVLPTAVGAVRYGYDEDTDCFYLHLDVGPSRDQKSIAASACLDANGQIIGLVAKLPNPKLSQ